MNHKWEKLKSTMASTQYRCIYCSEFFEIFEQEDIIEFPPIEKCIPKLKKHKWVLSSYAFNRGSYICNNCGEVHIAYEDNPKTWIKNITSTCKNNN